MDWQHVLFWRPWMTTMLTASFHFQVHRWGSMEVLSHRPTNLNHWSWPFRILYGSSYHSSTDIIYTGEPCIANRLPGTMFGHQTGDKLVWHNLKSSMKGKTHQLKTEPNLHRMYYVSLIHKNYAIQWGGRGVEIKQTAIAQEDTLG